MIAHLVVALVLLALAVASEFCSRRALERKARNPDLRTNPHDVYAGVYRASAWRFLAHAIVVIILGAWF